MLDEITWNDHKASFIEVTPELAEKWLGQNHSNRNLRPALVERYCRDMDAGNWRYTGETITFDSDGRLVDGQHRLSALVEHGEPLLFLVAWDVEPEAQDVMDTGAKRLASDMLSMRGDPTPKMTGSTVRLIINWQEGAMKTAMSRSMREVTNSEISAFIEADDRIGWATTTADALHRSIAARPSVVAFSLWLTGGIELDASAQFHTDIAQMRTAGVGDPRLALLRRLSTADQKNQRWAQITQSFWFIRSWNAVRCDEQIIKLYATVRGKPVTFPRPI